MFSVSGNHFYSRTYQVSKSDIEIAQKKASELQRDVQSEPFTLSERIEQLWKSIEDFFTPAVKLDARAQLAILFAAQDKLKSPDLGINERFLLEGNAYAAFKLLQGYNGKNNFEISADSNSISIVSDATLRTREQHEYAEAYLVSLRECPVLEDENELGEEDELEHIPQKDQPNPDLELPFSIALKYVDAQDGTQRVEQYKADGLKEGQIKLVAAARKSLEKLTTTTDIADVVDSLGGKTPMKLRELRVAFSHSASAKALPRYREMLDLTSIERAKALQAEKNRPGGIKAEYGELIENLKIICEFMTSTQKK